MTQKVEHDEFLVTQHMAYVFW